MISMEKDWEMLASGSLADRHIIILSTCCYHILIPVEVLSPEK